MWRRVIITASFGVGFDGEAQSPLQVSTGLEPATNARGAIFFVFSARTMSAVVQVFGCRIDGVSALSIGAFSRDKKSRRIDAHFVISRDLS
jgi:hypothetical protein